MHRAVATGLVVFSLWPGSSMAVTQDNFLARNTQDLVDLCTAPHNNPLRVAAIHFCEGYLVGAYHYDQSLRSGPGLKQIVCPPNPAPSRDEGVKMFVTWAQAHPQYMKERAVDTVFRFLTSTWPCPK
jgi:Ssp1 endopeptidase immunity protein Rap1a